MRRPSIATNATGRRLQQIVVLVLALAVLTHWGGAAPALDVGGNPAELPPTDPFETGPPPEQRQSAPPPSQPQARAAPDAHLPRAEKQRIQASLRQLGYYNGSIDALFGPQTRAAIRSYQQASGQRVTGWLTTAQSVELHRKAAAAARPPTRVITGRNTGPGCAGPRR